MRFTQESQGKVYGPKPVQMKQPKSIGNFKFFKKKQTFRTFKLHFTLFSALSLVGI